MTGAITRKTLLETGRDLMNWLRIATAETIATHGVPGRILTDLVRQGFLERPVRGVYMLAEPFGDADLVKATVIRMACPEGVICLRGAARLHGMHDNDTPTWTVAVRHLAPVRVPERVRVVRWSDPRFFTEGVEEYEGMAGTTLKVTDPARTVADMFRREHHRDKGGGRATTLAEAQDTLSDFIRGGGRLPDVGRYARALGYGDDVVMVLKGALAAGGNGPGYRTPLRTSSSTTSPLEAADCTEAKGGFRIG
jgi:hypothetical protein